MVKQENVFRFEKFPWKAAKENLGFSSATAEYLEAFSYVINSLSWLFPHKQKSDQSVEWIRQWL